MLNSIIEQLKLVKDFRKNRGKRHELWVVLTIIILALLTGNITYKQIDNFRKNEEKKLIKLLKIPAKKLPSYSTIRRVMIGINLIEIQLIFQSTVEEYYWQKEGVDWIAIDGKSLKNTLNNYENQKQNMLIMVSWFSQETKLVIKSESFESKQNSENAKVLSMIEKCGLLNKVFTLDALHCSKATTQAIIESKNDYLITAKGNQVKLHKRIKNLAQIEKPLTVYEEKDVSHGRNISRKVSVFDSQNVNHKNYPHLQSFIEVERTGFRGDKEYNETLYYISSQKLSAKTFAEKIKAHWLIENQVHWVKDVNFNEDKSRIKGIDIAGKFSLLVTLILNIYRSLGFSSIKEGQSWLGNNWEKILAIA
ncbi:MAG: ISAs1 family transposase [Planktothrix sp.]|jgi:predicted transposase YbfD/YdcC|uniref:ISAs1 family transposase n=2 Tax=Planktothrix sp. TaxID=3088171 RepID=UPI0038D357D3